MFEKLKHDSQLRLLTGLGLATALMIFGFGTYRFSQHQTAAAIVDFLIAALMGIPIGYGLITGNTKHVGIALCTIDTLCCILASWSIGWVAVYWHYLVLITNFFIAPPKYALSANLILTAALFAILSPDFAAVPIASVSASSALVIFFTYFFASRINVDRDTLEEIASLDSLTGLRNRRTMELCLTEAIERHRTRNVHYGLIILDVDHFKQINDAFGHAAGDVVLVELATILSRHMRRKDKAFRFGGEEFVVLVEVSDAKDLAVAAERIRRGIGDGLRGPDSTPITLSAGAAMYRNEVNWQEWFSLADEVLYRAKSGGRDRTVLSE